MFQQLRRVKSDLPSLIDKKFRTKSLLRFSRRLRNLPPEYLQFEYNGKSKSKIDKELDLTNIISQEPSNISQHFGQRNQKKSKSTFKDANSNEIITILSALNVTNKNRRYRSLGAISRKSRGVSCRPRSIKAARRTVSKCNALNRKPKVISIKKPFSEQRKRKVLNLCTVAEAKTAEIMLLFTQLKDTFGKVLTATNKHKIPKLSKKNISCSTKTLKIN